MIDIIKFKNYNITQINRLFDSIINFKIVIINKLIVCLFVLGAQDKMEREKKSEAKGFRTLFLIWLVLKICRKKSNQLIKIYNQLYINIIEYVLYS